MSKVKHIKLRVFSEYLENALDKVTKDPSSENIQRVRELFEIQNSLNGMGEWPFDTKLLLTIIIGIAIPVVLVILQIVCSRH
jgi:hypothetical protein